MHVYFDTFTRTIFVVLFQQFLVLGSHMSSFYVQVIVVDVQAPMHVLKCTNHKILNSFNL